MKIKEMEIKSENETKRFYRNVKKVIRDNFSLFESIGEHDKLVFSDDGKKAQIVRSTGVNGYSIDLFYVSQMNSNRSFRKALLATVDEDERFEFERLKENQIEMKIKNL